MNYIDRFIERTEKHISRVNKYGAILGIEFPNHDWDKLNTKLLRGYSLMSKENLTQEERKLIDEATLFHITNNEHHPEYWTTTDITGFTRSNPNPNGIIEATRMLDLPLIEMCCDWCAMSEEFNNSPFEWFDVVNGIRWKFTEKQEDFILETLERLWYNE